ncbi:carotenoid oxygenase family protein [Paraburkholderia sp. BL10I2N1]|uniref:carotenoid oxygenase family protein n=1 Tax=Paraburkholderia sp. BL10I2N1 TaxID=1938796 RepID=UPI00105D0379|nr:carotenoid oxygenase family protein [Paraburkholderia sp. BL10I2N1]TDN61393.1 carotenoid cleavage dioxygenase [Paraburkholderia sp. BL10I2N1]
MTTIDLNSGATAAVFNEVHLVDLPVTGTIPQDLNGVLVRNGPNPLRGHFNGHDVLDWWPEDAMLHGISLQGDRATSYRNRWARTKRWAHVHDPDASPMLLDTNPNVNVLYHAGEILALAEGGVPLAITAELETLGATRSHPGLANGMTAHPKVDPQTGELMSFRADWKKPYLRYAVTDANGMPSVELDIEMSSPSMMHDMAITATRSIFLDLNVGYDFSMLSRGHRMPLRWRDDHKAKLGIIPRHGGEVRWFEIAPCFILHVVNAYDADEATVVLDAIRYPRYLRLHEEGLTFEDPPLGVLWRYVIDLGRGIVTEKQMTDVCIELPRINEGRTGRPYRFLYAAEQPTNTEIRGVVRYDFESGSIQRYRVPEGDQNSEPVFVARPLSSAEDDGWLLVCVYRHATDTSDLVILDGQSIEAAPIATVRLPRRIPSGFHGAWLSKDC